MLKNNGLVSIQYKIEILNTNQLSSNNHKLTGLSIQSHLSSSNTTTENFNSLITEATIEAGSYSTIILSFEQTNKVAFEKNKFGVNIVPLNYYLESQSWNSLFYLNGTEVSEWEKRKLQDGNQTYDNEESSSSKSSSGSSVSVKIVIIGTVTGIGGGGGCIFMLYYFMKK